MELTTDLVRVTTVSVERTVDAMVAMCVLAPTALPKEHGARIAAAASMIRPAAVVLSADGGGSKSYTTLSCNKIPSPF